MRIPVDRLPMRSTNEVRSIFLPSIRSARIHPTKPPSLSSADGFLEKTNGAFRTESNSLLTIMNAFVESMVNRSSSCRISTRIRCHFVSLSLEICCRYGLYCRLPFLWYDLQTFHWSIRCRVLYSNEMSCVCKFYSTYESGVPSVNSRRIFVDSAVSTVSNWDRSWLVRNSNSKFPFRHGSVMRKAWVLIKEISVEAWAITDFVTQE